MSNSLKGKKISDSYPYLVQVIQGSFYDGYGNSVDLTGYQGPVGITGSSGFQGAQGPQGDSGTQGDQGITGPQGIVGPQGVTGASFETISLTAAGMYNLSVNGNLVKGNYYRITDYRSVNFLYGWEIANNNPTPIDPSFVPREVYTDSQQEIIVVRAIDEHNIEAVGYSETYPQDIIQYMPYCNALGVDLEAYNGSVLPTGLTVSGFDLQWDGTNVYFDMPLGFPAQFGHYFAIYFLGASGQSLDAVWEPLEPGETRSTYIYPGNNLDATIHPSGDGTRIVLSNLTENDYLAYVTDSLYVNYVNPIGTAYGWITRRQDTHRGIDVPFDFRGRKYRRFQVNLSSLNPALGLDYYGIGDDFLGFSTTGSYQDRRVFPDTAYNVKWEGSGGPDLYYYHGFSDNNIMEDVSNLVLSGEIYNNTVYGSFKNNKMVGTFTNNSCQNFYQNDLTGNFSENTLGTFTSNHVNSDFSSNNIQNLFSGNSILGNFKTNNIGPNFTSNVFLSISSCENNYIGENFQYNNFGDEFSTNTIGDNFIRNRGTNFISNYIGSDASDNDFGYNFTGCTAGSGMVQNTFIVTGTGYSADYSLATLVYGDYPCRIFRSPVGGSFVLEYFDGNSTQYTSPTT